MAKCTIVNTQVKEIANKLEVNSGMLASIISVTTEELNNENASLFEIIDAAEQNSATIKKAKEFFKKEEESVTKALESISITQYNRLHKSNHTITNGKVQLGTLIDGVNFDIKPKFTSPGVPTQINSKDDPQLVEILNKWLATAGINIITVKQITDKNGVPLSANAKADLFHKIIYLAEGKADIYTISEEVAHFFVAMNEGTPMVDRMMDLIEGTDIYNETFAKYSKIYTKNGQPDIRAIKLEAIGKVIADILNKRAAANNKTNRIVSLFQKLVDIFKRIFQQKGISSTEFYKAYSPFVQAAEQIEKNQGVSERALSNELFYELSSEELNEQSRILENLLKQEVVRDPNSITGYSTRGGIPIARRVHYYVNLFYKKVFRNPRKNNEKGSQLAANKGTILHSYLYHIMEDMKQGKISVYSETYAKVVKDLQTSPDFKDKPSGFYTLTADQFTELYLGVKNIYATIQNTTKKINTQYGLNGEAKILQEIILHNKSMTEAGTVDLLVVYPNGVVDIFDYKSMIFKEVGGKVTSTVNEYKRDAFDIQLIKYKDMLRENYGVTQFGATRIIPINMQLPFLSQDMADTGMTKESITGFKKIEMLPSEEKEYLEQLPIKGERTNNEHYNKVIEALERRIVDLKKKLSKDYNNESLKETLKSTRKTLDNILVKQNYLILGQEIQRMYTEFEARMHKLSSEPHAFENKDNMKYITDLLDAVKIYKDLYHNLFEGELKQKEKITDEEDIILSQIAARLSRLTSEIQHKIIDVVNNYQGFLDVTKPGENLEGWQKHFKSLSEWHHPIAQKLNTWVINSNEATRIDMQKAVEKIEAAHKALEVWAKSNGMTLSQAFEKLYDKETGKLISILNGAFYKDRTKAFDDQDIKFFREYYMIETYQDGTKTRFRYSGRAKEKFDAAYKKKLDELEYLKDSNKKEYEKAVTAWRRANDISFPIDPKDSFNSTVLTSQNRFLTMDIDSVKSNPKYLADAYQYMQKNQPLLDYYEMYIAFNEEFQKITGMNINLRFVANIRKDLIERVAFGGLPSLGNLKTEFLNTVATMDHNDFFTEEELNEVDIDGRPVLRVPVFYMKEIEVPLTDTETEEIVKKVSQGKFDTEEDKKLAIDFAIIRAQKEKGLASKSSDLSTSLVMMAKSVYTYKNMNEIDLFVKSLLHVVRSGAVASNATVETGKVLNKSAFDTPVIPGITSESVEAFEKFVKLHVYGKSDQGTLLGDEGKRSLKAILKISSLATLTLKLVLGVRNAVQILTNYFILGTENNLFSKDASNKAMHSRKNEKEKYFGAMDFFQTYFHDIYTEKANKLSSKKAVRVLTTDNMMVFLKEPDEAIDRLTLVTMMHQYTISENGEILKIKPGMEVKSIWDNFSIENGKPIMNNMTLAQVASFRRIVQRAATKIKGTVPLEDRYLMNVTEVGQVLMQYRSWLPNAIKTRFLNFTYDPYTESIDWGRYKATWKEISLSKGERAKTLMKLILNGLPIIGYVANKNLEINEKVSKELYDNFKKENPETKISFEEFVELRMGKIKSTLFEIQIVGMLYIIALLTGALVPEDDDDKITKIVTSNLYKAAFGSFLEASFFLNPHAMSQMLASPFALLGFVTNVYNILTNAADESRDAVFGENSPTDKSPLGYYTSKTLPAINATTDFLDTWDKFRVNTF